MTSTTLSRTTSARVIQTTTLTPHLLQVILKPEIYIPYKSGQYLNLTSSKHINLSYSIANAPSANKTYELHIRHHQHTPNNEQLAHELMHHPHVELSLPFGQCTLSALRANQPILFIAGGTGFAPIKAMMESLQTQSRKEPVVLHWRVRTKDDLYMMHQVEQWQAQCPWFSVLTTVSSVDKQSFISTLLTPSYHPPISDWEIVLAGPFEMVYALRDELLTHKISATQLHSDAFAFE
jgi:CDP-4-dehydro-6-deoxyglucose reductase